MTSPLFRYKDWGLFRASEVDQHDGYTVYGIHMTCKSLPKEIAQGNYEDIGADVSWLIGELPVCWNCNQKVPEVIQGLITLHEWDTND